MRVSLASTSRTPPRARVAALCVYGLLLAGSAAMLMPLLWLVRSSFMGLGQIFIFPPEWIPDPWRWDNYPTALTTIPFVRYFFNTLFILVPPSPARCSPPPSLRMGSPGCSGPGATGCSGYCCPP